MSDDWTIRNLIFAKLELKSIHGSPGLGFYRLIARIDYTTHSKEPAEEVTVSNIGGTLWVCGEDTQDRFLGYLRREGPESSLITYDHTRTGQLQFEIELDARRIEAIEEIRQGGDLKFTLNLYGIAHSASDELQHNVNATLKYQANQSTWIEVLDQMGYRKTMLLEIPMLEEKVNPLFKEAVEHLKIAQTHLLKGHFRDAVGSCRDVLESLSKALNDERQLPETVKSWTTNTRSMGKEERLRLIREAVKVLTHPARHADEVSALIDWGPEDARAVITMAALLLKLTTQGRNVE